MYVQQRGAGSSGASVSTSNSPEINQFDEVLTSGAGTTLAYSNAQTIHDNVSSINMHISTAISKAYAGWSSAIGASLPNLYVRFYFYAASRPSKNTKIFSFMTSTTARAASLVYGTAGSLRIENSSDSLVDVTSGTIPLGQWCRMELDLTGISGTTGNLAARLFQGANLESRTANVGGLASGSGATVGGLINFARFGMHPSLGETVDWDAYYSDLAVSDSYIGPLPFRGWGVPM